MLKRLTSIIVSGSLVFSMMLINSVAMTCNADTAGTLDNSSLLPAYIPDSQVTMVNGAPDWASNIIMAEVRIKTATTAGTFAAATSILDHYAEMGVNCLWLTPINDYNGYSNYGPDTVDSDLTGTTDYTAGWQVVKNFIDTAHSKNIRIILDEVSWGVDMTAPFATLHPTWVNGGAWGGHAFDWTQADFVAWYKQQLENVAITTGCDGFRFDTEPNVDVTKGAGYTVDKAIRDDLLAQGRKLLMISENSNERQDTYNLEQNGVLDSRSLADVYAQATPEFINNYNIVDAVKTGSVIGSHTDTAAGNGGLYQYYTNCISNHDYNLYAVNGNRLNLGYQAIFAPFIPLWYIGEEWNNDLNISGGTCLYFNAIDWTQLAETDNKAFYEDIKQMIRIRRQYPEIFNYYPTNHRNSNICKVIVSGTTNLQAYARYMNDTAILVIPNNNSTSGSFTATIPFDDMGMSNYQSYTVTDAETGATIVTGSKATVENFLVTVPAYDMRVIAVKGLTTPVIGSNLMISAANFTSWWSSVATMTELPSNVGVNFNWKSTSPTNVRNGVSASFPLDGLSMKFSNLSSNGYFALIIGSNNTYLNDYTSVHKPLLLGFDSVTGSITAYPSGTAIVQNNSILQSSNITGKPFNVDITKDSGGTNYNVTVTVGDQQVTGVLTPTILSTATYLTDYQHCYVCVSSWNNHATSLNFLGIGTNQASAVVSLINNIGTVSLNNGNVVRNVRATYNKLIAAQQSLVTNLSVLTAAETSYSSLAQTANSGSGYTILSKSNALLSSSADTSVQSCLATWASTGRFTLTNLANSGGLNYNYSYAGTDYREGYNWYVNMNNLTLQFDNYSRNSSGNGQFAIYLGNYSTWGPSYGATYKPLALAFNPETGTVTANPSGTVIITSDYLKYSNLRRFSVKFVKVGSDYTMTITTNGQTLTGTITAAMLTQSTGLSNPAACAVVLSGWSSSQTFSLDFVGLKNS